MIFGTSGISGLAASTRDAQSQIQMMLQREAQQEAARQSGLNRFTGSTNTALGNVALGSNLTEQAARGVGSIDDLIKARTPEGIRMIEEGNAEALRLAEAAAAAQRDPLQQFTGLEAFNEQLALLGLSGQQAQEQAIGGIPVSQFDRELQRRQRAQQERQAFAGGDVSGASLLGQQNLAAGQQAQNIQNRLSALNPLAQTAINARSDISKINEAAGNREAEILAGRGGQISNIRMGAAAPQISGIMNQAELSGLQGIANANYRSDLAGQAAGALSTFAPQLQSAYRGAQGLVNAMGSS